MKLSVIPYCSLLVVTHILWTLTPSLSVWQSLGAGGGGNVRNHSQLLPVVVMLELLGLLVPQVVLHHVQEVLVIVVQILLRVSLVRDLSARSLAIRASQWAFKHQQPDYLDHGVDPDVADLVVVHRLGAPGVDDGLMTEHRLPVNGGHSVNVNLIGQVHDGRVLKRSLAVTENTALRSPGDQETSW